jgi:hypothetical protein
MVAGQRYRTHVPFGKWRTQTFIAGLRCHGLTAPFIVNAPMNQRIFETWIETQLAPTLSKGDVVILDNVGFHKSGRAARSFDAITKALGDIVSLFSITECQNFFKASGYEAE